MSNRYVGGVVTETTNVAQSPWSGSWTEQAAMQGFGSVLRIPNSLRFRSSASAYLNRTPSVAGNQTTWTWSGWIKKGNLTVFEHLFGAASSVSNRFSFNFDNSAGLGTNGDYLCAFIVLGGTLTNLFQTNALFRDPSSWYHIVLAVDTTQATSTNRLKLYVNGVQQTFSTYNALAQNTAMLVNSAIAHNIASGAYSAGTFTFDGYMAEVNFIDGQALPPTAFGYINKETGVWAPITYTGTYGLNGFRLNFFNGTSTTTLGYDSSGNGNNWTTNNISLTAGSTYDWMIDSPSKIQGTSYGVGNYAVLNPLDNGGLTIGSANLNSTDSAASYKSVRSTIGIASGKWYWEVTATSGVNLVCGLSKATAAQSTGNYVGVDANGWGYAGNNGQKYTSGSGAAYGATYTSGDVVGIAFDADAGTLTFYKNNVSQGTAFTGLTSGPYFPAVSNYSSGFATNFGQRPFAYTPPSGYKTLCTQNLPVATIYNGAQYMAATLYTGNGTTQAINNTINGVSFQPDFVWVKGRSSAQQDHTLVDSVRGISRRIRSNQTQAETLETGFNVTAFNSNGFAVTDNTAGNYNVNGAVGGTYSGAAQYIGWQWKAGGTAVTNTAGTITSSVSANTTAGFSVVTYTGNGTNPGATIGHGLGVTPSMIITKARSTTGEWPSYHVSIGVTNTLYLNATYVASTYVNRFSAVSSTTFTTGSNGSELNTNGTTYVAYCFAAIAGYSAFGSYTGNGSSDGPFVYTGFRPRWILVKRTDVANSWVLMDSSRSSFNYADQILWPNLSDAEASGGTTTSIDFVSNGFKQRGAGGSINASGGTYIYAAFAENPFSVALAR